MSHLLHERKHANTRAHYHTIDKQAYPMYKALKNFRPYLLKNHCIVFIPHLAVRTLLVQQELGEQHANWMTGLQENDLEINPINMIKENGICGLVAKAVHALKSKEELIGWEREIGMCEIRKATPTEDGIVWYIDVPQYLENGTVPTHFSIRQKRALCLKALAYQSVHGVMEFCSGAWRHKNQRRYFKICMTDPSGITLP